ncbi:MAG: outer membrane protein [Opitutales bacterium]
MKKEIATISLLASALAAQAGTFSVEASALYVMPDVDETYASALTGDLFDFYNQLPDFINEAFDQEILGTPGPEGDLDNTVGFSIKANYNMDNSGFSFGPEFIYFSSDADSSVTGADFVGSDIDPGLGGTPFDSGFGSDEDFEFYGVMLNLFYDFEFDSFSIVAGAGVGYMWVDHSYSLDGVISGQSTELFSQDGDDGVFAYQFILGAKFDFTDSISGFLNYRYIGMEDPTFDGTTGPVFGAQLTPDYEPEISAQAIELGISFMF